MSNDDHYDIESERKALADLIERHEQGDDSISEDLRFPRLLRLWDAEDEIKTRKIINKDLRQNANTEVPSTIARQRPGRFRKKVAIVLHTRQAQRLFLGRMKTDERPGITGVYRFANACFWLYTWSAADNPYADLMLIDLDRRIKNLGQELRNRSTKFRQVLQEVTDTGFEVGVMESEEPVRTDDLNFASAYGYAAAHLIIAFDWYARLVMTLEMINQIDKARMRQLIYEMETAMRSLLESGAVAHASLNKRGLKNLCRADFAQEGPENDVKERIALAQELFGPLPASILDGSQRPAHFRPVRQKAPQAG